MKQIESRLTERATSLDRKDDNLTNKEKTLEQKEQSLTDKAKHIDEREQEVVKLEEQKALELERVAALSQEEAKEIILTDTRDKLTHEIATRIKEAEREVKERSDKMAKDLLAQAMQRISGEYVVSRRLHRFIYRMMR